MDIGGAGAVDAAPDTFRTGLRHLVKLVEDGGLEALDNTAFVGFLLEFERTRNQLALVDHQSVRDAQRRDLAGELCQSSLPKALTERTSMTGEPLDPVRPRLAAAQRDGDISPEQVDVVERALAKVDRVGFDPNAVDQSEELLVGFAGRFGPRDLRRLADQVVDAIDPDGTLPDDRLQADRRHFTMRSTKDGGFAGEFRLTAEAGVKLQTVLGPLAKPQVTVTETAEGRRVEELRLRPYGQRMHDAL